MVSRRSNRAARRDTVGIANEFELLAPPVPTRSGRGLLDVEDRRTFYPGVIRPVLGIRRLARLGLLDVVKKSRPGVSFSPGFLHPENIAVCQRRAARREVLFARRGIGSGKRVRRPRRGPLSRFSCGG